MATNAKLPPPPASNGVITAPATVGGNRKKAKRRAKQAAKAAAQTPAAASTAAAGGPPAEGFDEDPLVYGEDEEDYDDSEADADAYHDHYVPRHSGPNGYSPPPPGTSTRSKKKKGHVAAPLHAHHAGMLPHLPHPPPPPPDALRAMHKGGHSHGDIWNTSSAQERQNIKEFWLSLSEDERKSLLKIEKEAVLKKMKQQQKHSCSCTVCGRKRTAIEEELEVLYEGYYEELEQYAHHDHPPLPSADGLMPDPLQHRRPPHPLAAPPPHPHPHPHSHSHSHTHSHSHSHAHAHAHPHHKASAIREHLDEPDERFSDEEDDEAFEDEDEDEDEDDFSDEDDVPRAGIPDFFNFGQNLTVKDNLLTVADDLLKNDGRKFIEMMEQLAERRMQRESEAEYAAANPSHPPGAYAPGDVGGYGQEDSVAAGDEFDDDEASYDSQEEYDDEMEDDDEMGGLTEEQRMQEGRRMFQIFAARMFEQRVLNAYREKVAAERQQKLLEELQDETKLEAQRKAKKERDAQKKKEKKKLQQQAKAEEKARKEAEKAAEEARVREAQEKQLEDQRRKKEEQRKKKEEEKRKQDEERMRKETEKLRRQQEEQQRRQEAERKRAAEKARKEEQRKREREAREAREAEARQRKQDEEKQKRVREAKPTAGKDGKERERPTQQGAQPPPQQLPPAMAKRPSQMGMVAVPGVYPKQTPSGISSPHLPIATPAIPKAPTPARPRQPSQQGSHASSPRQAQSQASAAPSKSSSPGNQAGQQHQHQHQPQASQPKTIMQKPSHPQMGPQHPMQTSSPLHQQPMQPPPGMAPQQQHPGAFGGMSTMGFPGFQGPQGPMMHGNMGHRGPIPGSFPPQGPPMGVPNRISYGSGSMNGMPPPPGMMSPQGRGIGFPFDAPGASQPPPGFGSPQLPNQHPVVGQAPPQQTPGSEAPPRASLSTHSRHQSLEKERFENPPNQPIARPAPIQRPGSVKLHGDEVDEIAKIGSSALLGDDEPLPSQVRENRRHSGFQGAPRGGPGGMGAIGGFGPQPNVPFGPPSGSFSPFGPAHGLGQPTWNSLPTHGVGSWPQSNGAFASNSAFGNIGAPIHRPSGAGVNRPLTIRLAVCQACKQLNARGDGDEGFHEIDMLLRQIESNRPMLESPPTLMEIEDICETEGDAQNGGGELHVRKGQEGRVAAVKWEQDAPTPDQGRGHVGLGEIGSPMPSRLSPAGFGAPGMGRGGAFQSLGSIGSPPTY